MQNAAQNMRQEAALNKPQLFNDIQDKMGQISDLFVAFTAVWAPMHQTGFY